MMDVCRLRESSLTGVGPLSEIQMTRGGSGRLWREYNEARAIAR